VLALRVLGGTGAALQPLSSGAMRLPRLDVSPREVIDTARLAIQSAVATAAMFALMHALRLPRRCRCCCSTPLAASDRNGAIVRRALARVLQRIEYFAPGRRQQYQAR